MSLGGSKRIAKNIRESNLRNYYAPLYSNGILWNPAIDDECENFYTQLRTTQKKYIDIGEPVNRIRQIISKKAYDRIISNSLDMANLDTTEADILIGEIHSNNYARLKDIHPADVSKYSLLKFELPTSMGTTWNSMFNALMKLRVSNRKQEYKGTLEIHSAFSYGKPNQEVIHCQPNGGGCGLSALYAIGVISFDTFVNLICNPLTLNARSGTIGNVLYDLALSRYKDDSHLFELTTKQGGFIRYQNIFRRVFEIDYGFSIKQRAKKSDIMFDDLNQDEFDLMDQKQYKVLGGLVDFLNVNLSNDTSTLLRFGDRKPRTNEIDETKFGHTVVVHKDDRGQCYIADFWLSSKLTFQHVTKEDPEGNSQETWCFFVGTKSWG